MAHYLGMAKAGHLLLPFLRRPFAAKRGRVAGPW